MTAGSTSHPPIYVKAVSFLTTTVFSSIGLRNLVTPGKGIFFLPNDDKLQLYFFGVGPGELSRAQTCYTSLLGHMILIAQAAKVATVFSATNEGTFLRRNLLLAIGVSELTMAISLLFRFEKDLGTAGASFKGLSFLMGLEGSVFIYDSIFRPRPMKGKKD